MSPISLIYNTGIQYLELPDDFSMMYLKERGLTDKISEAVYDIFCEKLDVPCIVRKFDVKGEAKVRKLGEEETGRILRYEAFREIAGENGCIAVAHHQKDQAETVLMRLCRGTGLRHPHHQRR